MLFLKLVLCLLIAFLSTNGACTGAAEPKSSAFVPSVIPPDSKFFLQSFADDPRPKSNASINTYSWMNVDPSDSAADQLIHHGMLVLDDTGFVDLNALSGVSSLGAALPVGFLGLGTGIRSASTMGWTLEFVLKQTGFQPAAALFSFFPATTGLNSSKATTWFSTDSNIGDGIDVYVDSYLPNSAGHLHMNHAIIPTQWYHICVVLQMNPDQQTSNIYVYQDGVLNGVRRRFGSWLFNLTLTNAYLGWSQFLNVKHWSGKIDTFNVYSQAFTVYQIKALYAATNIDSSPITAAQATPYWRPLVHFTARKNWINDPNGLIYDDTTGIYHGFYQYGPQGTEGAGNWPAEYFIWGHATSTDLITWNELGIALPDSYGAGIWSGNAVFDRQNTSGLCSDTNCLVILYASSTDYADLQEIHLAYNVDGIDYLHFEYYVNNPVVTASSPASNSFFRDPSVIWYSTGNEAYWLMVVTAGPQVGAQFFKSNNLINWTLLSSNPIIPAEPPIYSGNGYECPSLFAIQVVETQENKWILLVSTGNTVEYTVGSFDGQNYSSSTNVSWTLDTGPDFYSALTFNNAPKNQRILIAWNTLNYVGVPTSPWIGSHTIPRILTLHEYHDAQMNSFYLLSAAPVDTLQNYRTAHYSISTTQSILPNAVYNDWLSTHTGFRGGVAYEFQAVIGINGIVASTTTTCFLIRSTNTSNASVAEYFSIGIQVDTRVAYGTNPVTVIIDRNQPNISATGHPTSNIYTLPFTREFYLLYHDAVTSIDLRVIVDQSSVEIFVLNGSVQQTYLQLPTAYIDNYQLVLYAQRGTTVLHKLDVWSYEFQQELRKPRITQMTQTKVIAD